MKTVLHVCCAGCCIGALKALRSEGIEVEGIFTNPNIHPLLEFRKRLKALKLYLESDHLPMIFDEAYGLERFVTEIYHPEPLQRCEACYEARLRRTAEVARAGECDSFTTTLLISPYQHHDLIRKVSERVAAELGVPFLYRDFRPFHDDAHAEAKRRCLYRQQYCGCCFSEYERYHTTTRELYQPHLRQQPQGDA